MSNVVKFVVLVLAVSGCVTSVEPEPVEVESYPMKSWDACAEIDLAILARQNGCSVNGEQAFPHLGCPWYTRRPATPNGECQSAAVADAVAIIAEVPCDAVLEHAYDLTSCYSE